MNAIASRQEWLEPYEEDDIYDGEFNNADGTVTEVQMLDSSEVLTSKMSFSLAL